MNSSTVIDKISDLNYKGFKEAYIRQMEDVNYHQLSFDERVYDLLDSEYMLLQPIYSYSQPVNIRTVRIEKSLSL